MKFNSLVTILSLAGALGAQDMSGKVFYNYTRPSGDDAISSYGLKRVYFTVGKKVSENISYKFQMDLNPKASPQNMYVKNAKVDWTISQGKVVIGMQGMNMFKTQENTWGKRYVEKVSMDQFKYSSSADMGIGFYKSMGAFGFSALMTNGAGYKKSENDDHKKLSFHGVYGEQKLNKMDGFNVGGSFSTESYDMDSLTVKNKSVMGVFGGYAGNDFRGGVEWNQKKDEGEDITAQITSLYGNYNINPNMAVFLKYDMVSPNTNESSEDKNYLIAGMEYSPGKGLMIAPNYRKTNEESEVNINFEFKF